jgi:RNase adaptor protein for sRNA GlmZ degradation
MRFRRRQFQSSGLGCPPCKWFSRQIPHYIREGKSYLTIGFGCTGGHHRSVMIAGEIRKRLAQAGYKVKETHRDIGK